MIVAILTLETVLVALAVITARTHPEDRPYAEFVTFVLATEVLKLVLISLLPLCRPLLFPLVDLVWMSQFGAQVRMARRMDGRPEGRWILACFAAHAVATVGISIDYALLRSDSGWTAVRIYWLRFSSATLSAVAYLRLLRLLLSRGVVCVGFGLGLAVTVLSIYQMVLYADEVHYLSYQVSMLVYLSIGIFLLGGKLHLKRKGVNDA
ncbi:MAG: hypothetical protein ACYS76_16415 [Planctomycetota bacterium]